MSCSHHSKEELEEELSKQRAFMSQLLGKIPPLYPAGRLNAEDQGELTYAVAADLQKGVVIIRFSKPVDWIGLHPKEIRDLAHLLAEKADQIDEARTPKRD